MGRRPAQLPGLQEISQSLWKSNALGTMVNLPQERTPMPNLWVGTATVMIMYTQLWQDTRAGSIYIDSVTASMSLVSWSPAAMADDCPRAMLEDVTDVARKNINDSQEHHLSSGILPQEYLLQLPKPIL